MQSCIYITGAIRPAVYSRCSGMQDVHASSKGTAAVAACAHGMEYVQDIPYLSEARIHLLVASHVCQGLQGCLLAPSMRHVLAGCAQLDGTRQQNHSLPWWTLVALIHTRHSQHQPGESEAACVRYEATRVCRH